MSENQNMESVAQPTPKKEKKAEKKPGFFARIGRWLREMKSELKKVQWPTRQTTTKNTLVVLTCVVIVGLFIWLFDFVATNLIQALIALFS